MSFGFWSFGFRVEGFEFWVLDFFGGVHTVLLMGLTKG